MQLEKLNFDPVSYTAILMLISPIYIIMACRNQVLSMTFLQNF